jgi:hypothetical protein
MRITKAFAEPKSFPIVLNYSKNHIDTIFNFSIQPLSLAPVPKSKERSRIKVSSRFDNSSFHSFSAINVLNGNQVLELQSRRREP